MRELPLFQQPSPALAGTTATPWWISLAILAPRILNHLIQILC